MGRFTRRWNRRAGGTAGIAMGLTTTKLRGGRGGEMRTRWAHGGHRYLLTDSNMTWAQAEDYAQALGGHLVTVDDASEQQWLTQNFGSGGGVWVGDTDRG